MKNYTVTWEMEFEADSPKEAAFKALRVHRDPESIATVFHVIDEDGREETVDLGEAPFGA